MKSFSGSSIQKDNEERGMLSHKIKDMSKNLDIDADKILSELIDSNCSHSYHSNFKDSIKGLASPQK